MINYNQKLTNERETQVILTRLHPIECLPVYRECKKLLASVSCYFMYSTLLQLVLTSNSTFKTVIDILTFNVDLCSPS